MRFGPNSSFYALCSLGLAYAACLSACDKAHDQSPGVEAAGTAGAADAGESGAAAGSPAGAGSAGRAGASAGSSSAGKSAAGSGGKPAAGSPAAGASGAAGKGSAAGSGGSGQAQAGQSAAGSGGAGKRCGTRGGAMCAQNEFCNFEPDTDCGGTDRGGACEGKPQVCTDIFMPVCGCDSRTYSSDCNAHAAGISVKHDGLCTPDECEAAGGNAKYSDGASVPACDAGEASWMISGGKEQVICCLPKSGTGMGMGGTGTAGKTCGGIAALKCDAGQFCNYEEASGGQGCGGGIADAAGKCEVSPKGCTKDARPTCSCDRHTYNNPCEAHAAGVSVMHDGACTESDCQAIGGRVAYGTGPGPMCNANETEHGYVVGNNGAIPVEGALCCLP